MNAKNANRIETKLINHRKIARWQDAADTSNREVISSEVLRRLPRGEVCNSMEVDAQGLQVRFALIKIPLKRLCDALYCFTLRLAASTITKHRSVHSASHCPLPTFFS